MRLDVVNKTVLSVQSLGATKGERTRERILDLAYDAVLSKGFAATSIEELVEAAGITKSGFFYHFRDKNDLANQLLDRFLADQSKLLDSLRDRARELTEDPLHSLLVFLKLFAEIMADMVAQHPGCIVALITFQDYAFDREVARKNTEAVLDWRRRFGGWVQAAADIHPMTSDMPIADLADGLTTVVIGSIVTAKAVNDPGLVTRQVMAYREFIRLLFAQR